MIKTKVVLGISLSAVVIVADQITKTWALEEWFYPPRIIEITPFLNLVPVWNTGVSFGFLANVSDSMPYILSTLSILVIAALIIWLFRAKTNSLICGLGLVIGGAFGNVIDRLRYRAVVDFIDFHFVGCHWPAFNLADTAITIGVGLLLFDNFTGRQN